MNDTTIVPCHKCRKPVRVPAAPVRDALRRGRDFVWFCSRLCNLTHVAEQGTKQQEDLILGRH